VSAVGTRIGVGKEADVYMVADDNNENRILKLERYVCITEAELMVDLDEFRFERSRPSGITLERGNLQVGCICLDWLLRRSLHS
jgi:hypothetical protein